VYFPFPPPRPDMRRPLLLAVCALLLGGGAPGGPDLPPVLITGRVSAPGGEPLGGVDVTVYRETAPAADAPRAAWTSTPLGTFVTVAEGDYWVPDPAPGRAAAVRYRYVVDFCVGRVKCRFGRLTGTLPHPAGPNERCRQDAAGRCVLEADFVAVPAP
jgi:hypothetical protein